MTVHFRSSAPDQQLARLGPVGPTGAAQPVPCTPGTPPENRGQTQHRPPARIAPLETGRRQPVPPWRCWTGPSPRSDADLRNHEKVGQWGAATLNWGKMPHGQKGRTDVQSPHLFWASWAICWAHFQAHSVGTPHKWLALSESCWSNPTF